MSGWGQIEGNTEDRTRLRTLVMVDGNTVMENIEYNTNESGCQMMMNGDTFFLPAGVQQRFKGAKGIEAYIGAPIVSPLSGEVLGHIAATDPNPVSEEKKEHVAVLKIFASRIAVEMERMKAEKELEKRNQEIGQRLNEIELYETTLKNLREQVYWLDKNGKFIRVNSAVVRQTGYTDQELKEMSVFDINPTLTRTEWDIHWKETKSKGHQVLETEHKSKDGEVYPVEVTNNFLEHAGQEYFCSTVRDIRLRKLEEDLLRTVSEATSGVVGEDFLIELARNITMTLNMRYALITECANDEKTRLRTLCYVDGRKVLDNIEYDIAGIPCEIILQGKDFFLGEGVQAKFPREKGIEAAVGVPIFSSKSGEIIGHILALDPDAVTTEKNQTAILKIFAARAGAEIERLKAENKLKETLMDANIQLQLKLKQSEQRYRDLFEEAPIAYVNEGLDSKFITANRAALKILGIREDEVNGTYGFSFIPDTPEAQKRVKDAFEAIKRGENADGAVLELRRKDNGKPLWIQWWSKPDPSGKFTRIMFIDITT